MSYNWRAIFLYFAIMAVVSGCAKSHRGVMENNIYYSSQSPNVQIKIKDKFEYRKGATGQYQHQFFDNEGHRLIYIHYQRNDLNENKVDYYEHPDHWIYAQFSNSVELERFEMDMVGEKWYVRDAVRHVSPESCFMYRDLGVFTDMHDLLKLIYFLGIPSYDCKDWKSTHSLSDSQLQLLEEFRDGFTEDIEITNYHPVDGEGETIVEGINYDKQPSLESKNNSVPRCTTYLDCSGVLSCIKGRCVDVTKTNL